MASETGDSPPTPDALSAANGRPWAAAIALATVAITMVPYLVGLGAAHGRQFMWLGYNLDDSCVYLSWMRQAADGAGRTLNLFTTDAQHGMAPNPLFWTLGRLAGVLHLPLIAVYHTARIVSGLALLLLVWELICSLVCNACARRYAYLFVCLSAGLGWLPQWWDGPPPVPIDTWQPEAITFLSLYMSPLFCFSMCLQVAIVFLLWTAEREDRVVKAMYAGMCAFLLGLTHTYDVVTMAIIWFLFLIAKTVLELRRGTATPKIARSWIRGVTAGLIGAPAVGYIAYQLHTEAVFQARANVATLAPALRWVLLGYGLTLVLAAIGVYAAAKTAAPSNEGTAEESRWTFGADSVLLLTIWLVANIASAYLPFTFQRKLIQGAHFPIAILAGIGAAWLLGRPKTPGILKKPAVAMVLAVAILCPTNLLFLLREAVNFQHDTIQTGLYRPYLHPMEIQALDWARANSDGGTAIQPLPWAAGAPTDTGTRIRTTDRTLMCFTPGLIDRPVYCGHWGETPDYPEKLKVLTAFPTRVMPDAERIQLLRRMRVKYIIFTQKPWSDASPEDGQAADALLPSFRGNLPTPSYLRLRYTNPYADVYEVIL